MSEQRPEPWEIWLVVMQPHPHPAVVLSVEGERMVVMPITSDESFAAPQHRMALEPSDEGFGFTGLRAQVSWACPTGIFATDVSAARMKHGFLPGFYREIAQQLLSDAMIAAIVRKRLGI